MSHQIICAQLIGVSGIGTNVISTMDVHTAMTTLGYNYNYKAAMSLDGLFVPFSTDPTDQYLLHFEIGSGDIPRAIELNGINTSNIKLLTPSSGLPSNLYEAASYPYYKGVALRAPLVLAGFGYDINDYGVQHTNKCGPLDARWDDERKVWGFPPSSGTNTELARMTINTTMSAEDIWGTATLFGGSSPIAGSGGTNQVQIYNYLNQPMIAGAKSVGWRYLPESSGYIIIQHQFYPNTVLTNIVCTSGIITKTSGTIYTEN